MRGKLRRRNRERGGKGGGRREGGRGGSRGGKTLRSDRVKGGGRPGLETFFLGNSWKIPLIPASTRPIVEK